MQELSNGKTGLHIQISRRLVGKNHLGRIEYGAGYHDTLLLSARKDIVELLAEEKIVPTSMIDLSDGLASDLLQICKASKCGARIYLDRIPIARQTTAFAEEIHTDPVVAALNGGEDYELLFTVPLALQERVMRMGGVDVIGHITAENTGAYLVTPDGGEIRLKAQGFRDKE